MRYPVPAGGPALATLPRILATTALTLALALAMPSPVFPDDAAIAKIESTLEAGNAEKAAKLVDAAMQDAGSDELPTLRYLRFKIHVYDLGPGGGKLFKKVGGGKKLAPYEEFLDGLEADVRAEGEAALPFLTARLGDGGPLDRLLILGLFEEMVASEPDLPWSAPGPGGVAPSGAAIRAIEAAVRECVALEEMHGAPPAEAIQEAWDREDYVQDAYAARSGLGFLAELDPAAWGATAIEALACRGASGAVVENLERVDRLAADLRDPLVRSLTGPAGDPARVDALALLGRVGDCRDVEPLQQFTPDPSSLLVSRARAQAIKRIRWRHGCSG